MSEQEARAEANRLRNVLQRIADGPPHGCGTAYKIWNPVDIAREGLGMQDHTHVDDDGRVTADAEKCVVFHHHGPLNG